MTNMTNNENQYPENGYYGNNDGYGNGMSNGTSILDGFDMDMVEARQVLTDYSWFYEERRNMHERGEALPPYPTEFIDRATNPRTLELLGATPAVIDEIQNTSNYDIKQRDMVQVLYSALKDTFGIYDIADRDGNPFIPPAELKDGSVNTPAMMKMFRQMKNENAKRWFAIKSFKLKSTAPWAELPKEFIDHANDTQFLLDIGLTPAAINQIRQTYENCYTSNMDDRYIRKALNQLIGGNRQKNLAGVTSAEKIQGEFRHRKTYIDLFIDEFRKENSWRMKNRNGRTWPPFSDQFIYKAHDRNLLEAIGMAPEGIDKVMNVQLSPNGLTDRERTAVSIPLGQFGNKAELVVNQKEKTHKRQELDDNSGIVAIYYELAHENSESFAIRKQNLSMDLMRFSDSLIAVLFNTELIPQARANSRNWREGLRNWICMLPDDSVLCTIGLNRDRLLNVMNCSDEQNEMDYGRLTEMTGDENAVYTWMAMNMLYYGQFQNGNSDNFWNRLSEGQRISFNIALGKSILGEFKFFKNTHSDLFPQRQNNNNWHGNNGNNGNNGRNWN